MAEDGQAPRWVGWWFRGAAVYGAVALILSAANPPASAVALLPHFAFAGTALAFQIVFWIVGAAPVRHRPLMLAGVAEKLAFGIPALAVAVNDLAPAAVVPFAALDLLLGAGFLLAWRVTPPR